MAVSQEDILARIQQIYTAQGNTPQANAQIAREAQQFGVTPEQIAQAANISSSQVRTLAEEAGQAFAPMQMTGGMLGGTNINLTQPSISPVSLAQPTEPTTLDLSSQYEDPFEQAVFDIYRNTTGGLLNVDAVQQYGGMFKKDVASGLDPKEAAQKYVGLAQQTPEYEAKVLQDYNKALTEKM